MDDICSLVVKNLGGPHLPHVIPWLSLCSCCWERDRRQLRPFGGGSASEQWQGLHCWRMQLSGGATSSSSVSIPSSHISDPCRKLSAMRSPMSIHLVPSINMLISNVHGLFVHFESNFASIQTTKGQSCRPYLARHSADCRGILCQLYEYCRCITNVGCCQAVRNCYKHSSFNAMQRASLWQRR